jgi:hypothetical protein
VDEATEPVSTLDFADQRLWRWFSPVRWLKFERAVRPLGVVVVDKDAQHLFEVTAAEDEQPVETPRADRSDEAFRDRVRLR